MLRRTKIVTTLGPATDRDDNLRKIIEAGANMVRLNFSHGLPEEHVRRAEEVRAIAKELKTHIAIMGDLQGPKIRVSTFRDGKVMLKLGAKFILDSTLELGMGDETQVGLDYKHLPNDVSKDDILMLDDGRIQLKVLEVLGPRVVTEVTVSGSLSNNKGINKKGGGLSAAALTDKDKADIKTAAKIGVDYLAVSFPRNGQDINYARSLTEALGFDTKIVAKVERAESVASDEAMDDIIVASDAVMVARGDLGVEIGDPELMAVQKQLIRRSRKLNRIVITATQMMESMISSPMPTRAEVMDVANAVLDGTDAVMLSGETAAGDYPVETVKAMADVCIGAERQRSTNMEGYRMDYTFDSVSQTVAMSTMFAANHMPGMKAIITLTESGSTALMMSRLSSGIPIFSLSRHTKTLNRTSLFRGVYPIFFNVIDPNINVATAAALDELKARGFLSEGDMVIMTHGNNQDLKGETNTNKIIRVS